MPMWDASSLYQPVRAAEETNPGACAEYDTILMRVAHAMAQLDDIDAIFHLVNSTLVETLSCDRSSTFLMGENHSLRLGGQSGSGGGTRDAYESDAFQRAAEPIVRWLCRERRSLVVSGPPFPPMLSARLAAELNLRSLMVVPLLDGDRVAGAITASRTDLPVPFTPAEAEFAEGLASHAVVALRRAQLREDNARHVEALRQSEQRYRALVERAQDIIFSLSLDGTFSFASPSAEKVVGYTPEEMCGMHFNEILLPASAAIASERFAGAIEYDKETPPIEYDARRKDGTVVKLEVSVTNLYGPDGAIIGRHGIARDVTERTRLLQSKESQRRRAQAALRRERRQRERAETLLQVVTAAASTLSVKKILIQICDAVARMSVADRCSIFLHDETTGLIHPLMSLGINDPTLWGKFLGADGMPNQEARGFEEARRTGQPVIETRVPDSGVVPDFWAETFQLKSLAIYPMIHRDRVVGMMTVDSPYRFLKFPKEEVETCAAIAREAAIIIENARLFERTQQEAKTDFLTGFPNHRYLQDLFEQHLAEAEQDGKQFCIAMVDVDNFKLLNDVHGHQAGDAVLKQIATVMRSTVRPEDIVGRYGGDEFLLILPGASREDGENVLERVSAAVEESGAFLPGVETPISMCIAWGVAAYPADGTTRRGLISLADAGLMERKLRHRRRESGKPSRLSTRDLMQKHPETMLLAESLLNVIDQKDAYTGHHSKQDASLCLLLADHLELPERDRYFLWLAGMLHDIGKIGVPDSVLRKPGSLTPDEWSIMCQHVTMSENMVRGLFGIEEVCDAVRCHHERFDGKGYPNGLKGDEIPRLARMLSVVDAYSAMVHDRPYRRRMNEIEAIAELRRHAGTQFDPEMVDAFLTALGRREELAA